MNSLGRPKGDGRGTQRDGPSMTQTAHFRGMAEVTPRKGCCP